MSRIDAQSGRFVGRTAVITGAAAGIGRATAERLHAEGAAVVIADIDEQRGASAAAALGDRAVFVRCDVSAESDWREVVSAAKRLGGGIDVLVSNAVFQPPPAALHDVAPDVWIKTLEVGLTGAYLGVRACIEDLQARSGSIVLVSSVHALVGLKGNPAYASVKGALTALARQLAVEYGPAVRVNSVLPGPILTAAWDGLGHEVQVASAEATVLQRMGRPSEVASAIAFLTSDDASYITGAQLLVDAGWTITKASA